jgi:signal transduction histidine kinase
MTMTAVAVPEEQHFILSTLSPSVAQRRLALAVVLALLVAFVITAGPLGAIQPGRVDAFVPAFATAMFVNDLITAVLLFAQFSILRSGALLVIASGYLFTALVIIPWLLTFPGVFAPRGLLGAGLQSTNWLYILWHGGFPTCVMAYALLKDADPAKRLWDGSVGAPILSSVAVTMAVVCAATFLVTAGDAYLPRISLDPVHFSTLWLYVAGCLVLWSVLTLIVLWMRRRSVLDLWLMVVICAYAIEIYLVAFPGLARFSLGWYFGRVLSFMSGSLVLFVLLYEITILYAQLLSAVRAQRREREARLMTGDAVAATIAHEVKQPLSGMITNADAGLRWLDRPMPDLDEAKAAFKQIAADGHRAGAVIGSIRAIFKRDGRSRTSLDINDLIGEALVLLRGDLQKHRILVQTEADAQLPQVASAWEWACRSAARLSRPMMAACWLLRTPLGALYFNLSWALVRRHPPRLRDCALPISTRLIRIIVPTSARDTAASRAFVGTAMQCSTKAITQLATITPVSGTCLKRRCPTRRVS